MTFIYIIVFLIGVSTLGFIFWRYFHEYLVYKIQKQEMLSKEGKRKLPFYKSQMRQAHSLTLLGIALFLAVGLLSLLYIVQFPIGNQMDKVIQENKQLKTTLSEVEEKIITIRKNQIYRYPEKGISFDFISGETLFKISDRADLFKLEQEFAYKLTPFLGQTIVLVDADSTKQTCAITVSSYAKDEKELELSKSNLTKIFKDLSKEATLSKAFFSGQLQNNVNSFYERTYTRNSTGVWQIQEKLSNTEQVIQDSKPSSDVNEGNKNAKKISKQKGSVHVSE